MDFSNGEQAQELLDAQAHVWNQIFSFINSFSLKCAIQLNIPDIIHKHGRPMTISELVDALPINKERASCVPRLMRILVHSGFFTIESQDSLQEKRDEGYFLTPSSRLLLQDEPLTMRPYLLAMLDPIMVEPWQLLSEWFENDHHTSFEMVHGRTFWDSAAHKPKLNKFFNEAMASDAKMVSKVVIQDCAEVFEGINSLVDVGGGTGTMAKAIADAFQHIQCTVLDLPHVVDGLQGTKNLAYVGGDMFDFIPPTDAVLLKWILHDWSDEECIKILEKCKEAILSKENGGKVIIIDMIVGHPKGDDKSLETQLYLDMLMMTTLTGKERDEKDWVKLFFEAGFHGGYKINRFLGLRSLIEVYP